MGILVAFGIVLACVGLGAALLRGGLDHLLPEAESDPLLRTFWHVGLTAALGLGVAGLATLALGLAGVLLPPLFAAATAGGAALAWWHRGLLFRRFRVAAAEGLLLALAAAALLTLLWMTSLPDIEIDGITYHLSVPKAYLLAGRITAFPLNMYVHWHFLSEMHTLWALALLPQSVIAAKVLELLRCALWVGMLAAVAGAWYGRGAGLLAGLLGLLMQDFSRYATSDYTDCGIALYLLPGAVLLARWAQEPSDLRRAALGSLLLGFALGVKPTAFGVAAPVLAAALGVRWLTRGFPRPVEFAAVLLPMALAVAPWCLKNWINTGNPVYPFLPRIFPLTTEDAAMGLAAHERWYPPGTTLGWRQRLGAVHAVISNMRLHGGTGFVLWGALGALLLMLRVRGERQRGGTGGYPLPQVVLLLGALGSIPFLLVAPFWRFLIPAWPLAVAVAVGEATLALRSRLGRPGLHGAAGLLLAYFLWSFLAFNTSGRVPRRDLLLPPHFPTLTLAQERAYYERYEPSIHLIDRANALLGPEDRLLASLAREPLPLLTVPFLPNAPCVAQEGITSLAEWGKTPEEILAWFRQHGVTHVLTAERFEHESARAFAEQHLELLAEQRDQIGMARLYRVR